MISKTAEYALRAVAVMAGRRESDGSTVGPVSADCLYARTQVPRRYLHKVLQDLVSVGLVSSRPGPGGGYELVGDVNTMTILDVVNAVDPIERIRHCPLGLKSHTSLCPLHRELDKVYAANEAALCSVTIGQLVRSKDPIIPLCEVSTN